MRKIKQLVKKIIPRSILNPFLVFTRKIRVKNRINSLLHHGNSVFCPCCNKTFNTFLDYKFEKQYESRFIDFYKNTICPNCGSKPRQRIQCYGFNKNNYLPVSQNNREPEILIFAAEYCIKEWFNRNRYKYITADLFDLSADLLIDIQKTPFPDDKWSLIICNHVLQHVENYKAALLELYRILRKEGILEITVATNRNLDTVYEDADLITDEQRLKSYGEEDYLRIFGNDVEKILESIGFSVEIIRGDDLPKEIRPVIGPAVQDENRVYVCKKI